MSVLAVIGSTALYLLYAWLASAIVASYVSNLKGFGERPGLASGMLLSAGGVLLWLVWPPRREAAERGELALKWSVPRVLLFTVLSAGLYLFYWFYVTRRLVDRELGQEGSAGLQTAGLLVPILDVVIVYRLWRDVGALRERHGLGRPAALVYALLWIVPIANLIALGLGVRALDETWDATGRGALRLGVTFWETLLVAAGFVLVVPAIVLGT